MPDEKGGGRRSPEEIAREHEKIQREAANRSGRTDGGLRSEDIWNVAGQQQDVPDATSPEDLRRDHSGIAQQYREWKRQQAADLIRESEQQRGSKRDEPSILESVEPRDARARVAEAFGGGEAGRSVRAGKREQDRALLLRVAALGMALAGIFLILWAFTGGRTEYNVVRSEPLATLTPRPATTAPATSTAAPTSARPVTALSAGPVVATRSGTATIYTVEDAKGDGLRYEWRHSATCSTHSGESTATYTWDHPHPPCPDEPFHASFITVQISDSSGQALVRQYTLGSREGRGQVPAGGGVFTPQPPSPTTIARTATPVATPTTAAATATAATTTTTASDVNYPLAGVGAVVTMGGLALAYVGRKRYPGAYSALDKEKDPCEELRRREAEARSRRDASRERAERMDRLRGDAERTRADADRAQRDEQSSKDDRHSWGEDAEIGPSSRIYTNPDQRGRIERAEAAAREARAAADAAKSAYDAAGDGAEHTAAQQERREADAEWQAADAALKDCLRENAPAPAPPSPPPPTSPPAAPTPPTQPVSVAPTPPIGSTPPQQRTTTEVRYRCSLHCDLNPTAYRGGMGHANADLAKVTVTLDEQGQEISRRTEEDIYDFAPAGNEGAFWVVVYGVDGKVDRDPARNPDAPRISGTHMYYDISEESYNAAKAWADGQVENPPTYRATTSNCVDFAVDLVAHAGVTTPDIWSFDESNFYVGGIINTYTPSLLVAGMLAQQEKCEHSLSKGKPFKADPEAPGGPDFWVYECTKCGLVRKGRTANGPDN